MKLLELTLPMVGERKYFHDYVDVDVDLDVLQQDAQNDT